MDETTVTGATYTDYGQAAYTQLQIVSQQVNDANGYLGTLVVFMGFLTLMAAFGIGFWITKGRR